MIIIANNVGNISSLSQQEGTINLIRSSKAQYCNSSLPSNCSQLPSISMPYTSIQISQSILYTSITSKEYFYTTTNSVEGIDNRITINTHTHDEHSDTDIMVYRFTDLLFSLCLIRYNVII